MYHSITIGDKNTWDDWHLIPMTRPLVEPPEVATNFVEIPGMDGTIDLTDAVSGGPAYKDRTGTWKFIVMNGYGDWAQRFSTIMGYLRGLSYRVVLEDDSEYFYEGRVYVTNWTSDKAYSTIEFTYNLKPYKFDFTSSVDEWLWDSFNFETGTIPENLNDVYVDGTLTRDITGTYAHVIPEVIVSAPMTITYNDRTVEFQAAGTYKPWELTIVEGTHQMVFIGTGRVTVKYRGGVL